MNNQDSAMDWNPHSAETDNNEPVSSSDLLNEFEDSHKQLSLDGIERADKQMGLFD